MTSTPHQEKFASLARILAEEVAVALRECEGQRYFVTEKHLVSSELSRGDAQLSFAEATNRVDDVRSFLSSKASRENIVATIRNNLSEALGPIGTFAVLEQPPLVHDENCPSDQVRAASCDLSEGYPHVRCVVVNDRGVGDRCLIAVDMVYYRVS